MKYCPKCGNNIDSNSKYCSSCRYNLTKNKRKWIAVVLVLLFGFFGWLYTYKKDKWKFWLYIPIFVLIFCAPVWYIAFVRQELLDSFIDEWLIAWTVAYLIYHLMPFVDQVRRPKEFFESYHLNELKRGRSRT